MVDDLRRDNENERQHRKDYKRLPDLVGGFVEAADENRVENGENDQNVPEQREIRLHQSVFVVRRDFRKSRPERRQRRKSRKRQRLDDCRKQIPGLHRVAFRNREKHRVERVVGLARVLEGLEQPQTDKESAHQDRVARQQGHQRGRKKNVRQGRGREAQLFIQQAFHTATPFHS